MKHRHFALLLLVASVANSAEPKLDCKEAKGLAAVTSQLPDYQLSSDLDSPAKPIPPFTFKPFGILSAAHGQTVCIAVVVSASGTVEDVAAYSPTRVALSKSERKQLLSQKYVPAEDAGQPVKSIVLIKAW
jgi:hypothetical protein